MNNERIPASLQRLLAGYNVPEQQLEACFHQAYSSIRNVVTLNLKQGNYSEIRKIFVSNNQLKDNPIVIDMVNEGVVKLKDKVQLPILLLRKIVDFAVTEILSIVIRKFSCNSVSKLLRYLGLNSVMVLSEEIRRDSVNRLKYDFAVSFTPSVSPN